MEDVNDNPPNFAQNHFVLEVNEVSGAAGRTSVSVSRLSSGCVSRSSSPSTPQWDWWRPRTWIRSRSSTAWSPQP